MKSLIKFKTTTLLVIPLVLACFALLPSAQAVTPAPDGGYAAGNTAEGTNALLSRTTGAFDTAIGAAALLSDTTGGTNTAVGTNSQRLLTSGNSNTAVGVQSLFRNNGNSNTALGLNALFNNTTGNQNTALGQGALSANTTADGNVATGFQALGKNTTGGGDTATGFQALFSNTNGFDNTASGFQALLSNSGGVNNTASGAFTLGNNVNGGDNCAFGFGALFNSTTSFSNAVGFEALVLQTNGVVNNAFGSTALFNTSSGSHNSAFGDRALFSNTLGSFNTAIGDRAGEGNNTGSFNVYIGQNVFGIAGESFQTKIKNVGTTLQNFSAGVVDFVTIRFSDGRLGHSSSSRRYKEDIKPMDKASELLYQLKPVTYRYKKEFEPTQNLDYGLVAEDVAKVDPKLAIRNEKGQIESVRYLAIYNMMLNEFLKEHQKVQQQEATIAELKSTVALQQRGMEVLTAQLKEQAAQIQKVSAQVGMTKPAPKVVANQ